MDKNKYKSSNIQNLNKRNDCKDLSFTRDRNFGFSAIIISFDTI